MKSLRVIKAIGWCCSERASKSLTHWLAELRILRLLSREKPHVDTVTCLKLTPDLAEHSGEIWAKRWIDMNAPEKQQNGR
jgi:hypothetical protein